MVSPFEDLGQRVRTHICYAQVFGDALTEEELVARCAPDDADGVRRELAVLAAAGLIERAGDHWFLRGHVVEGMAARKLEGRRAAEEILRGRQGLLRLLARLPVVRMLAVSGSVAWGNPERPRGKGADLDLFIITAPGSVHVVRLLLRAWGLAEALLERVGRQEAGARICDNYVTDGAFLEIMNESFYTASDALQVIVLKGADEYRRFLSANAWISRYYPLRLEGKTRTPRSSLLLHALNVTCFATLAGVSWLRGCLKGWTYQSRPLAYQYCVRFRPDRTFSLLRASPAGGGHQPEVAGRFRALYCRHFGHDLPLHAFLFPGTTRNGVHTAAGYAESTIGTQRGYGA